jgi:transmembrane protein EpsG
MLMQLTERDLYSVEQKKKRNTALAFFFVLLTVLVMLRHKDVGNDTRNYIEMFKSFSALDWRDITFDMTEFGYRYFNKAVALFTDDPQVFLAITALITSAMIYPTYKRLCIDTSLTIALFCTLSTFVMMFSGIRQMLAIGIGFIAYGFTRKKKLIPFILAIALAMTIHTSAFLLAIMYPLYHVKIKKNWLILVIPLLAIIFAFNEPIFEFLGEYIEEYTRYEADIAETGAYMMLVLFTVFTVFAFVIPRDSKLDDETIGLRNFLVLSLALQMFAPLHTLAMRMNYYYIIFIPLLIPRIIMYRKKEMRQLASLARIVMVIFFTVYFFYNAYTADNNLRVFPYHFFWESV